MDDPSPVTVPVQAVEARITTLHPAVALVGTLVAIPEKTARICARTTGAVLETFAAEGRVVHAGEVLVRLDERQSVAARERSKAGVDEAQAILERLEHGPLPQEIDVARQETRKAGAAAGALRVKLEAMAPLVERGEVSAVQHRRVTAELEAAEADHDAAKARLALLEAGTRPEEIAQARARLASARAQVGAADLAVEFCTIKSPIEGIVTEWVVRRESVVSEGAPIATIIDISELFAQAQLPRDALARVEEGADVDVRVSALDGTVLAGKVSRLAGRALAGSGGVEVWARISNPRTGNDTGLILRPGLGCRMAVHLPDVPGAIVVPVAAIADRDGISVLTVIRDGKAYEIEVTLGVQTAGEVQVLEGVTAGDLIATEGGYGLPAGCPVRVVSTGPAAAASESSGPRDS